MKARFAARRLGTAVSVLLMAALAGSQLLPTPAGAKTPGDAADARLVDSLSRLPLAFEQNRGQTESEVKFLARGAGYALFLTPREAVLRLAQRHGGGANRDSGVLRARLVGANSHAAVAGEATLPGHSNYFLGNDHSKWRTEVEQFAKVRYRSVYPGIDLVYYGNQQQLEYDFVVAPGADPDAIRMAYRGALQLSIDDRGDLRIKTRGGGELIQRKPLIYQTIDGQRKLVSGRFALAGHGALKEVSFKLTGYDGRRPLVIDPVLMFSTYLGGNNADQANGIAVDSSGNVYLVGNTQSSNFPTQSPIQNPGSAAIQGYAFVAKVNPSGTALVYSTYLGSSGNACVTTCPSTTGNAIAVDSNGNAYVTGTTFAADFPTQNPFDATDPGPGPGHGDESAFVTKFNAAGNALVYSTYLNGPNFGDISEGSGIAVDAAGSSYVTGVTEYTAVYGAKPNDFPTKNPFQASDKTSGNPASSAFLTKFTADGSGLVYSTYFGGTSTTETRAIAVDAGGQAHITGDTASIDLPIQNPIVSNTSTTGGGFVAGFDAAGSSLVYSTYLGAQGNSIAVDGNNNIYVAGSAGFTAPTNFLTFAPFQATFNDNSGFVSVLRPGGTAFVYSTYFPMEVLAIAVDGSGDAYIAGGTANSGTAVLPTQNPIQTYFPDGATAFISVFTPTGSALIFSSPLGGSKALGDFATAIAVDATDNIYVAGSTLSTDFPTVNPIQASYGGFGDAFLAKINPIIITVAPSSIPLGQSATLTWSSGNSTSCSASGAWSGAVTISGTQNVSPTAVGSYTYTLTCAGVGGNASFSSTLTVTANSNPPPTVTFGVNPASIRVGQSAALTWSSTHATACTASGAWSGGEAVSGNLSVSPTTVGTATYTLTCSGAGGSANASAAVMVTAPPPLPTVSLSANVTSIVSGQSAKLTWSSTNATACTASGAWSGSEAVSGTLSVSPTAVGTATYTLTCTGAGGSANASATVTVTAQPPLPTLSLSANVTSIVSGQSAKLTWSSTNATACTASGAWSGSEAVSGNLSVSPATAGTATYTLTCTGTGGSANASATVTVTAPPMGGGGGGGIDLLSVSALGLLRLLWRRRPV